MLPMLLLVFVRCFPPANSTNQADLFCAYEDTMTKYSKAIRSLIDRSPATNVESIRLNAMLERIHAMTEALQNLAAKRDPALPLEAHTLKVAKATEKLKDKIAKTSREFDELRSQALKRALRPDRSTSEYSCKPDLSATNSKSVYCNEAKGADQLSQ